MDDGVDIFFAKNNNNKIYFFILLASEGIDPFVDLCEAQPSLWDPE